MNNQRSLTSLENLELLADVLGAAFNERSKSVDERSKITKAKNAKLCSFLIAGLISSIDLSDQYKTLANKLLCDDDKQAESDLALVILSSVNATKAMESAYSKLGKQFSSARFDLYSDFTDDLEDILQLAEYLLHNSGSRTISYLIY